MSTGSKISLVSNVFIVIISALMIINFSRMMTSGEILTFQGFLENLSNFYTIPLDIISPQYINVDWGLFNFLRDFFNSLVSIFTFGIFVTGSLLNALLIIAQLLPLLLLPA